VIIQAPALSTAGWFAAVVLLLTVGFRLLPRRRGKSLLI
jgi:hypothetical protein